MLENVKVVSDEAKKPMRAPEYEDCPRKNMACMQGNRLNI
jgi:hypothetical protein